MPTINATIYFGEQTLVEDDLSPSITVTAKAGGYAGHGYQEFAGTISEGSDAETATSLSSLSWGALGVPTGTRVTGVTCQSFWVAVVGAPLVASHPPASPTYDETTWFSITAGDGATSVLQSGGHVNDADTPVVTTGWLSYAEAVYKAVHSDYSNWDTPIKLKLGWEYSLSDGNGSGTYKRQIDYALLAIDYEPLDPGGGGGGGGDGGGDGDGGGAGGVGGDNGTVGGEENDGECDLGELIAGWPVQDTAQWAVGWAHEGRYYLSVGNRTLCFDSVTRGWSDTGYGKVVAAHTLLLDGKPDMMFISRVEPTAGASVPAYGYDIEVAHRMLDFEAWFTGAPWKRRVYYGPFDGVEHHRKRRKRAIRLQVYGSFTHAYDGGLPARIGTLTMHSDTGRRETYPIVPVRRRDYFPNSPHIEEAGVMFEQRFTRAMVGRLLWAELEFTYECVMLTDVLLEYVPLS